MAKRRRRYKRWMREGMGNWRDTNATPQQNAERFALARIGMLQEALARQSSRPIAANTARAGAYNNAQQAFQASQGLDPAARWRMISQALAAYTTPGTDPRDTLYQFWNP
jgi:hypothetical protein